MNHSPIPLHNRAFRLSSSSPYLTFFSTSKRAQPLSNSLFSWPVAVFKADYRGIIRANGLDAYFFVRFLRMMVKVLLPIWIISWIVLFPITAIKSKVSGKDSFDKLSFGNVANNLQPRYAAHLILVYIFTCKARFMSFQIC